MESYTAWNGQGFMVYWILRQAQLEEVGLTQTRETMTLRSLIQPLIYCNLLCGKGPHWEDCNATTFGWEPRCVYLYTTHGRTKFNFNFPRYGLWTSVKGPHNFMGHSIKWPQAYAYWVKKVNGVYLRMNVVIFSVPVLDNSINSAFTTAISASSSNCSSSESFSFNLLIVQFKDVIEDKNNFEMATNVNYGVASSSS